MLFCINTTEKFHWSLSNWSGIDFQILYLHGIFCLQIVSVMAVSGQSGVTNENECLQSQHAVRAGDVAREFKIWFAVDLRNTLRMDLENTLS